MIKTKIQKVIDLLFRDKNVEPQQIVHERLKIGETHGTGCNFSAAVASFLAKGYNISESFKLSNSWDADQALKNSIKSVMGTRHQSLDCMYDNSEKFKVLIELQESVSILEKNV